MSGRIAIGIDLGTTQSCVAIFEKKTETANEKLQVILDVQDNEYSIPSYVAYGIKSTDDVRVGTYAKFYKKRIENIIYDSKRLIGRQYDDETIQNFIPKWTFKLRDDNDRPKIVVEIDGKNQDIDPITVSSMIVSRLIEITRIYLRLRNDHPIDAVVAVPAYFNDSQREATIQAIRMAKVNLLALLNEPTAAALVYGYNQILNEEKNVLVFDFGGGTVDVSVISILNNQYKVKGIYGDTSIGGRDIDEVLVGYVLKRIKEDRNDIDILNDKIFRQKVLQKCELAKKALSRFESFDLHILDERLKLDFEIHIVKRILLRLAEDIFQRAVECIDMGLENAGMTSEDIDDVIIIGGSSKIPRVVDLIQQRFESKQPQSTIATDHAIAMGAAIYAAKLSGDQTDKIKEINLQDINSFSLGVKVYDIDFYIMIPRLTKIPYAKTKGFTNPVDYTDRLMVSVYEGESDQAANNTLIGEFIINIEPCPKDTAKIDVTFEIDQNGILKVTAIDKKTNLMRSIVVENAKTRLSKEAYSEMEKLMENELKKKELNKEFKDRRNKFLTYLTEKYDEVETDDDDSTQYDLIMKRIKENREWLKCHYDREFQQELEDRFQAMKLNANEYELHKEFQDLRDEFESYLYKMEKEIKALMRPADNSDFQMDMSLEITHEIIINNLRWLRYHNDKDFKMELEARYRMMKIQVVINDLFIERILQNPNETELDRKFNDLFLQMLCNCKNSDLIGRLSENNKENFIKTTIKELEWLRDHNDRKFEKELGERINNFKIYIKSLN